MQDDYQLDQTDLAYIAGFVDGEGTLSIVDQPGGSKPKPNWVIHVSICNTDRTVLDWILFKCGGSIHRIRPSGPRRKESYTWKISGLGAVKFIGAILPHLKMKKPHAEILLGFRLTVSGNTPLTQDVKLARSEMVSQIRLLNKRGV